MKWVESMTWLAPIVVAIIGGLFSYAGVVHASKVAHDSAMIEHEKQMLLITQQIDGIKKDVIRLEQKQDKHNAVIERTYKLEQRVDDLEKQIN